MSKVLIKVKCCEWIDLQSTVTWFGIKGLAKDGLWYHLCDGKKALVFSNPDERDAEIKKIRETIKASAQKSESK
jgi:hypothetical protein